MTSGQRSRRLRVGRIKALRIAQGLQGIRVLAEAELRLAQDKPGVGAVPVELDGTVRLPLRSLVIAGKAGEPGQYQPPRRRVGRRRQGVQQRLSAREVAAEDERERVVGTPFVGDGQTPDGPELQPQGADQGLEIGRGGGRVQDRAAGVLPHHVDDMRCLAVDGTPRLIQDPQPPCPRILRWDRLEPRGPAKTGDLAHLAGSGGSTLPRTK